MVDGAAESRPFRFGGYGIPENFPVLPPVPPPLASPWEPAVDDSPFFPQHHVLFPTESFAHPTRACPTALFNPPDLGSRIGLCPRVVCQPLQGRVLGPLGLKGASKIHVLGWPQAHT